MSELAVIFVGIWLVFSSITTLVYLTGDIIVDKSNIVYLCKEVGQFQYKTTVVECKIKVKG